MKAKIFSLLAAVLLSTASVSIISNQPTSNVQAGRRISSFAKKYRGTWYYRRHKIKVTRHQISGYSFGHFHKKFLIHKSGSRLKFYVSDVQPGYLKLVHRHGHKCLQLYVGIGTPEHCFRSKKVSKYYS